MLDRRETIVGLASLVGDSASRALGQDRSVVPNRSYGAAEVGINLSGAEYSFGAFPGEASIEYCATRGVRLVRLPVAWELLQHAPGMPLDRNYVGRLRDTLDILNGRGMRTILDVHNYGRYDFDWHRTLGDKAPGKGNVIGSTSLPISAFADLWLRLAAELSAVPGLAGYGLMNEPYDMGGQLVWTRAAQAAIDAIRIIDLEHPIYVCGDQWGIAHRWTAQNDGLHLLRDPSNLLIFEAHCYFDRYGSGKYEESYGQHGSFSLVPYSDRASPDVGVNRIKVFADWCRKHGVRGFIGEFGVPDDDERWLIALDNTLRFMTEHDLSGTLWVYITTEHGMADWFPTKDPASVGSKINLAPIFGREKRHWSIIRPYMRRSKG